VKVGSLPLEEAVELYHCHGLSTQEVATRAGCHPATVIKVFSRHGIPRRKAGNQPIVLLEHLEEARRRHWTKSRLARELGVGVTTVINAQKRLGFSWPGRDGKRGMPRSSTPPS
jgi:transposase